MQRRRAFLIALLVPVLAGCNSPAVPPQQNYATIYGVVYDGATGQPLSGATVLIDSVLSATSGANGAYAVANVPIGPFSAVTSASGYTSRTDQGTVASGDRYLLNVSLYK
ncbi:MAG: carboxypeptidase regulatory-like domain-containing protein [Candidatus Eremiobacteraeota bacterium]|nr:carboxypeptidase regulatory-like domain-containing protein [Candidatus Eremiobacteraeota bacterium]